MFIDILNILYKPIHPAVYFLPVTIVQKQEKLSIYLEYRRGILISERTCRFRNLLALLESAIILRTSMLEINVKRPNISNRAFGFINSKTFSKFHRRHCELIFEYNVGLKTLIGEGLSDPEFYGDFVYKIKKLIGNDFSFQLRKIITRYRR